MHALSAFAALSALAAATFTNAAPAGRERLYARSYAEGNGIEARFEFWGRTDGTGTFVKIEVLKGLFKDSPLYQGPYGYHVHTNPVGEERDCLKVSWQHRPCPACGFSPGLNQSSLTDLGLLGHGYFGSFSHTFRRSAISTPWVLRSP